MKKIVISLILALALVFSFAACDKTEPVDESVITLEGESLNEALANMDKMLLNPDRYTPVFIEGCGMDEKTAKSFFEAPEEWLVYSYTVAVTNVGSEEITVYGIETADNGTSGVYLNCDLGAELGISPEGRGYIAIDVLCSDSELSDDEVKAIIDGMSINVIYSAALPDDAAEGVTAETKIATVNTAA